MTRKEIRLPQVLVKTINHLQDRAQRKPIAIHSKEAAEVPHLEEVKGLLPEVHGVASGKMDRPIETDLPQDRKEAKELLPDLGVALAELVVSRKTKVHPKEAAGPQQEQAEQKEHLPDLVVVLVEQAVSRKMKVHPKEAVGHQQDQKEVKGLLQDLVAVPVEQAVSRKKVAKVRLIKENLLLATNRKELQRVLEEERKQKIQKRKQILVSMKMSSLAEQVLAQ